MFRWNNAFTFNCIFNCVVQSLNLLWLWKQSLISFSSSNSFPLYVCIYYAYCLLDIVQSYHCSNHDDTSLINKLNWSVAATNPVLILGKQKKMFYGTSKIFMTNNVTWCLSEKRYVKMLICYLILHKIVCLA